MALASLKGRATFKRVLAYGQRRRSNGITVYCDANGTQANRYGVMVSAKAGRAVVRSRVRRWARALLRGWNSTLLPGHDLIVFANRPEAAQDYREFAGHLAAAIGQHRLAEGELEY
jgi:ribonuclease P protein component